MSYCAELISKKCPTSIEVNVEKMSNLCRICRKNVEQPVQNLLKKSQNRAEVMSKKCLKNLFRIYVEKCPTCAEFMSKECLTRAEVVKKAKTRTEFMSKKYPT